MDNQIKRGEIYYIHAESSEGSEQNGGRPGVVVSNDTGNLYAPVIEVVYLTSRPKKPMPTHVEIQSAPRPSIALCEQIHTVDKARVGDYAGCITEDEQRGVDNALRVSLELGRLTDSISEQPKLTPDIQAAAIRTERDIYKGLYESVIDRLIGGQKYEQK